jgi:hypothetical protein
MTFRQRVPLDGTWLFQIDPANRLTPGELSSSDQWRQIYVPLPWQAQFEDLRYTSGAAWYRRTLSIAGRPADTAILHFGAVDYHATVWVNGEKAGEHEGGYLPFEFDVTHFVHAGENDVLIRVADPTDDRQRWPDYPFSEIPHGKQSWYGPVGGIWQSVWLEWRPAIHFLEMTLTPHPKEGAIDMVARLSFTLFNDAQILVRVVSPEGHEVGSASLGTNGRGRIQLDPAKITWWSPETPTLYRVTATLLIDGKPVDVISTTCGFRTIEAHHGRIYLNGKPIYLRGALDQAYYPGTIYTPPSIEFLEDQARKAKALGLNCLRTHIKVEDPRYYEVADRLGLLIWTEIPNWVLLSARTSIRVKETFQQIVERDWNHPSIFAWSLVNEDWGTDLTRNAEHRRWLAEFYHEARRIDPYRLIVDNSPCHPNFHVAGDLEDYHAYRAIPDHAEEWDAWVADFAQRADWAWASDYEQERRDDLPLIVSEFGNWGLPHPDQIQEDGREPWWFETGHEWGEGIVYPHGMQERFDFWRLADIFGSFDGFIQASQEHMARSLAYEISTMRLQAPIGGYVITEFTDVHWECNGLLDMQRHVKQGLEHIFTPINQDRVVILRPQRWSGHPGEQLPVALQTFGVDGIDLQGVIHWQAGALQGTLPAPGGTIQVPLSSAGMVTVQAQWHDSDGRLLASNHVALACVESVNALAKIHVLGDPALAATLKQAGYTVMNAPGINGQLRETLLIARNYTQTLHELVQRGGRALLLAGPDFNQGENLAPLPIGGVRPRAHTIWEGDWATAFSWLKKQGPFAHLPGTPLLEMEYAEIMPDAIITGVPAWAFREHTWAGLALGWIHKPVSLITKGHYGRGSITLSTFNLSPSALTNNAIAQALFAGLVELA